VFAIAEVRGGGGLGRPWHDDGKLLRKANTFTDFIAVAEDLVAAGWTAPDRLAAVGGSAGGLLVGAVLNARPDLFRAALAQVPFVDLVTSMLDPDLPLTVVEREEWGDPRLPDLHAYMASYDPYANVRPAAYPDVLATAGLNDPRVGYWEAAKWVARLREANTGAARILLRIDLGSGHGGPSGRYDSLREVAFEYAFLLDRLVGISSALPGDAASGGGT
jgi:oligopeptidase B